MGFINNSFFAFGSSDDDEVVGSITDERELDQLLLIDFSIVDGVNLIWRDC
jgi:hypothetical protein